MKATTKIELTLKNGTGRASVHIPAGACVTVEPRGPYVYLEYNGGNYRMPAQVMNNLVVTKTIA